MSFLPWVIESAPPSGAAGGDLGGTYPNPTVTATHLASPLPIAQGGTAAATAAAAFAGLAPLTTAGDLIIENATPAPARLAVGSTSQVLGVAAGLPAWGNVPAAALPAATTSTAGAVKIGAATATFQPSNPAGTVSLTLVMMGTGATCAFTPASSGLVRVSYSAWCNIATAVNQITVGARFGTSTAPVNGAAVTGTRFGGNADIVMSPPAVTKYQQAVFNDVLSLTPATAYWFDLALATSNAADTVTAISIVAIFQELQY